MLYDRNMVLNLSSRLWCIIWRKETLVANISKQVNGSMCIYTPGAMLVSGRLIHVTPAQCAGSEISTGHGFNQSNATCAELHNDDTTLEPKGRNSEKGLSKYMRHHETADLGLRCVDQESVSLTTQLPLSKSHQSPTAVLPTACEAYISSRGNS